MADLVQVFQKAEEKPKLFSHGFFGDEHWRLETVDIPPLSRAKQWAGETLLSEDKHLSHC